MNDPKQNNSPRGGFTMVEMMAAMLVVSIMMILIFHVIASISHMSTQSMSRTASFSAARAGFEALTRNLSQATLRSYHASADASGTPVPFFNPSYKLPVGASYSVPSQYVRSSELHFIIDSAKSLLATAGENPLDAPGNAVFFQAPLGHSDQGRNQGLYGLLNVCGYYVEFSSDLGDQPSLLQPLLKPQYRYRLMEVRQPAEANSIYKSTQEIDSATGKMVYNYDLDWIKNLKLNTQSSRRVLAENVIDLVLLPRYSSYRSSNAADAFALAPHFVYDSRSWEKGYAGKGENTADIRNQLPPVIDVVIIALDETGALLMSKKYGGNGGALPPFQQAAVKSVLDLDSLFQNASQLETDLKKVKDGLSSLGVSYRIFRSEIVVQESL